MLGLDLRQRLATVIARIDVKGQQARRGKTDADARIRVYSPPVADNLLIRARILVAMRDKVALRMLTRRMPLLGMRSPAPALPLSVNGPNGQDVPAKPGICEGVVNRLRLIFNRPDMRRWLPHSQCSLTTFQYWFFFRTITARGLRASLICQETDCGSQGSLTARPLLLKKFLAL